MTGGWSPARIGNLVIKLKIISTQVRIVNTYYEHRDRLHDLRAKCLGSGTNEAKASRRQRIIPMSGS